MIKNPKIVAEKAQKQGLIFNIPLNSTPKSLLLRQIRAKVARREQFLLFTPHPEMVLTSIYDREFLDILKRASFLVPDGVGIIMANKFLSLPRIKNKFLKPLVYLFQGLGVGLSAFINRDWLYKEGKPIKGRKLFSDLIALANKKGWRVFLLGGMGNEAKEAAESLKISYKSLKVTTFEGPVLNTQGEPIDSAEGKKELEAIKKINEFGPVLTFVAFGAPKGEVWSTKYLSKLKTGGIMSVGGTFNYFAGNMSLPPRWMEKNFEWLWRVIQEPKRITRIFKAVVVFPIKVFGYKIRN
jgi:N-acetylglucosaminyldiphosphoundecaprenol N-acetyl-beta-D-mannosaminyltransferase